jgi:hypothetical protein
MIPGSTASKLTLKPVLFVSKDCYHDIDTVDPSLCKAEMKLKLALWLELSLGYSLMLPKAGYGR